MRELNIPSEHYDKFKFYINLPKELKQQICDQLRIAPIGLSPSAFIDFASNNIINLAKERIGDIYQVYFNLVRAKENLNVGLEEFLEVLGNSLKKTGVEALEPTEEVIADFEMLLSNSSNTLTTTKVIDLMTDNPKTFVDARIFQDIRPVFDEDDGILGSVIIHNLKIFFKEDDEVKELHFSLDDNDLDKLTSIFKKAKEKVEVIKNQFKGVNLIEIK